ncbi:NUDIX domain-containing protein [Rhizobiaceae bacterium BDR2-2]|uniref:GDP-mannose pyrophosphatase n=1 Tax=Ectorhizobium quercum TaxID=2965071 RepID=A0AAE3N5N7_9HYPH|nr:NUDIX domain-containing protein [Ectorhizobium quercum]MCX8999002.1 NUDIX domain-containing protein [Ectorhizobium quercum]
MSDRAGGIRVTERETLYRGFLHVEKLKIDQTLPDGRVAHLVREVHDHGHGAAILLYDAARGVVVLVRQFRTGPYVAGDDPFLLEVPAGLLDGEAPGEAICREAIEETGFFVAEAHRLFDVFASPGTLTEKITLFAAFVSPTDRVTNGGGLDAESEHIEFVELPLDEAFAKIGSGEIRDAKTVILLQWAMMNRAALDECRFPG